MADDIRSGRLVAPAGFIDSGQHHVVLRRTRRQRRSAVFCAWLAERAQRFSAAASER